MKTAVQHHKAGRLQHAEQLYRQILQLHPSHPVVLHSLAMIAYQTGRYDAALELVREAVAASPQVPCFQNTRGLVLEALGEFELAMQAYQHATLLKPDYAEAYHNMAIAMLAQGKYAPAVEKCEEALSLAPAYAQVYNTMGFCLQKLGRSAQAVKSYERAVQLVPDFAEAHNHLGFVLAAMGLHQQAIDNYRQAVQIDPQYAEAHWNLSLSLLLTGSLNEGWKEYKWRRSPDLRMTTYPHCYQKPLWDGSSFAGKRLLVHYEQGFGDTIQFVRYLPAVKARGGTVILEVRKPLVDLLRHFPGVDELLEASLDLKPMAEFDLHVSLMDLPRLFGTAIDRVPADVPYLYADSAKAEYWRNKLSGPDFKVGIVWSGSSMYERNHVRSCRLEYFASLAAVEGVKLYGLQKDGPASQLEELAAQIPVTNLAEHLHDFSDTAAVIQNLDLIVSVDTSVPHLAGAMGKPVWLLVCCVPAWQWMLDRQDSPWYPTMRLFRQKESGDWKGVFRDVVEQLKILLAKERPAVGRSQTGRVCNDKVPVIIPAYKGKDQLEKCITHLKRQTVPAEIFIRDNNRENIYFTAAINEGIRKFLDHDCGYILMLNQDMYLEPNAVEEMVRFMESHRKCGIGTPLQLSGKVPGYVVHAGCLEAFPTGQHQHGWLSEFTKDEPVFWGNGACMILRKEMIREIGLFDSNYVLVGSDSDYCFTARSRGWQVWRIAGARGIHEGGVTGRIVGKEIEILKLKDMTYFAKKWLTGQLYKQLSCEGRHYTPEMIDEMMARIRAAKTKLEGSEAMEVGQAQ